MLKANVVAFIIYIIRTATKTEIYIFSLFVYAKSKSI